MEKSKGIAVVGASKNPEKDAHSVPKYLKERLPSGTSQPDRDRDFGEGPSLTCSPCRPKSQARLMWSRYSVRVKSFLRCRQVVELSKRQGKRFVFWSQLGLENDDARKILEEAGIPYVMNACMRVVYGISSLGKMKTCTSVAAHLRSS